MGLRGGEVSGLPRTDLGSPGDFTKTGVRRQLKMELSRIRTESSVCKPESLRAHAVPESSRFLALGTL